MSEGLEFTEQPNEQVSEQLPEINLRAELIDVRERILKAELQKSAQYIVDLHASDARTLDHTLILAGLAQVQRDDPKRAEQIAAQIAAKPCASYPAMLQRALQLKALGYDHGVLAPEVADEFAELINLKKRDGSNTEITTILANDQIKLSARIGVWQRYAKPALERLRAIEKTLCESETEGFDPSMDDGAMEELDESEIEMRVLPYRGGYFREAVHTKYDLTANAWVTESRTQQSIVNDETEADDIIDEALTLKQKVFTFMGKYLGSQTIPLPGGARVNPVSLSLPNAQLVSDEKGIVSLLPKSDQEAIDEQPFELKFTVDSHAFDKTPPTEEESNAFGEGCFSEEALTCLAQINEQRLTPMAAARRLRDFVTTTLKYSTDKTKSDQYRSTGRDYFRAIAAGGEADCDVANTYFLALMRELGISSRLITGYHVRKDPRFEFAALAGTKHAWAEVWDGTEWHRMDATPPKAEDDQDDQEKQEESDGGGGDDVTEEQHELAEDIDEVENDEFAELPPIDVAVLEQMIANLNNDVEKSPETMIAEMFARKEGVSLEEVQAYRHEIAQISATVNPKTGKTIAQEYAALYDRFIKTRWISHERYSGPVRQSEGEELMDPTMVYIDIIAGDADPLGFKEMAREQTPEHIVTDIEDDQLLDMTASMEQRSGNSTLLAEQRKMALVHLEELAKLNDKMNDVSVRPHLTTPLGVRTSIIGFRGHQLIELKSINDPLTEKLRVEVARELKKTEAGRGNLLAAIRQYRAAIPAETAQKLKSGLLTKILTIFSDGNVYCPMCGKESCNHSIDQDERRMIVAEIAELRGMGVIVHGIGFTEQSRVIAALTNPDGVTIPDATQAVMARHQLILKSLG